MNKNSKSAWAKKMDQLSLSKAELKKGGEDKFLASMVKGAAAAFKAGCVGTFGAKWWKRLCFSAAKKKRSPIGYAADVLLK